MNEFVTQAKAWGEQFLVELRAAEEPLRNLWENSPKVVLAAGGMVAFFLFVSWLRRRGKRNRLVRETNRAIRTTENLSQEKIDLEEALQGRQEEVKRLEQEVANAKQMLLSERATHREEMANREPITGPARNGQPPAVAPIMTPRYGGAPAEDQRSRRRRLQEELDSTTNAGRALELSNEIARIDANIRIQGMGLTHH